MGQRRSWARTARTAEWVQVVDRAPAVQRLGGQADARAVGGIDGGGCTARGRKVIAEAEAGEIVMAVPTVRAFARTFLVDCAERWKPATRENCAGTVRRWILPAFGNRPVDAIGAKEPRSGTLLSSPGSVGRCRAAQARHTPLRSTTGIRRHRRDLPAREFANLIDLSLDDLALVRLAGRYRNIKHQPSGVIHRRDSLVVCVPFRGILAPMKPSMRSMTLQPGSEVRGIQQVSQPVSRSSKKPSLIIPRKPLRYFEGQAIEYDPNGWDSY